jgi:hypothetical protein
VPAAPLARSAPRAVRALHRLPLAALLVALLAGCATAYDLTLMPRTSGKTYSGTAVERSSGQADVTIQIEDKVYTGTWQTTAPTRTSGTVSFGIGIGSGRGGVGVGVGTAPVIVENPGGGEAKALLQAADGSGLRCDFRGFGGGNSGAGGTCMDDKGLVYDVQIRTKDSK